MIEHELILLGLLKESPKHGYEIKKKIREILSLFAGVDLKSIYYPLRILEKKGLVAKHTARSGKRPQRFIYKLTPKGESRFKELLVDSFFDFKRPQFSLDLSLYFIGHIDPKIVKRKLQMRMRLLRRVSRNLESMASSAEGKKSSALTRIVEHNLQMVKTESNFLADLIKTYK